MAFCLSSIALSAQHKGQIVAEGSLIVSSQKAESGGQTQRTTAAGVAVGVGYFITNSFKIGALVSYASSDMKISTFGPTFSYYVPITSNFYYTPGFNVEFGSVRMQGIDDMLSALGLGLEVGTFEFKVSESFGLSLSLLNISYVSMNYSGYSANVTSIDLGQPSVGFKLYF